MHLALPDAPRQDAVVLPPTRLNSCSTKVTGMLSLLTSR